LNAQFASLFWALVLLEIKHFLCDFVAQTGYQVQNKHIYGHPGGLLHAGLHGIASLPAILLLTNAPLPIAAIIVAEFIVHYHVDWLKAAIIRLRGVSYDDLLYWILFGADQFLHQATYIVMLGVLVRVAAS
jgi:hypothetical protein